MSNQRYKGIGTTSGSQFFYSSQRATVGVILQLLGSLGKLDQIKLVTFDAADETLRGIEEGHIFATVAQDPYNYGFEAVSMPAKLCRGDETDMPIVGRGSVYVGAEAIKLDSLDAFRKRLEARTQSAGKKSEKNHTKSA